MYNNQLLLESLISVGGFMRQGAATRAWRKRFRTGGARIAHRQSDQMVPEGFGSAGEDFGLTRSQADIDRLIPQPAKMESFGSRRPEDYRYGQQQSGQGVRAQADDEHAAGSDARAKPASATPGPRGVS